MAQAQIEQPPVWDRQRVVNVVKDLEEKYGVSAIGMMGVLDCETGGNYSDPAIQSSYIYKTDRPHLGIKAGDREESYGFPQWHVVDRDDITKEQAIDGHYSLEHMAREIQKGKIKQWSCYKHYYTQVE